MSIMGPQGKAGATGARGPQGARGPTGIIGQRGATGKAGHKGLKGLVGAAGQTGKTGLTGKHGLKGSRGGIGKPGHKGLKGLRGPIHQDDVLDRIVQYFDDVYGQLQEQAKQISQLRKQIDALVATRSGRNDQEGGSSPRMTRPHLSAKAVAAELPRG